MQRHRLHNFNFTLLFISILFLISSDAFAGWETGVKAGYDSNIDRAINGGISDSFVTGFLFF